MKTAKGHTYSTLLNINIDSEGSLTTTLTVPMELGTVDTDTIATMITFINDKITSEQKPAATFERCLERIELHRTQLTHAYVTLIETYQRCFAPKTRTSPIDKAQLSMLDAMPDRMLRQFAAMYLVDKAAEYVLPDERHALIIDTMSAMKATLENGTGTSV